MSEADEQSAIDPIVPGLIQALTERLARHGLGEIEVRQGEIRVRVVAPAASPPAAHSQPPASHAAGGHPDRHPHASSPDPGGVTSPAVGYFSYADGLGPGFAVEKGDALGYVDVLGVRHDVRAPRSGVVRNLVTEAGEAVEYGQLLIELEAAAS